MEMEKQRYRLGKTARSLSLFGGGAAVWYGFRRKSLFGSAVAVAGASYVLRGITGNGKVLESLGVRTASDRAPYGQGIKIRRSLTIRQPREKLYGFWKNFENLPHFMKHLESVRVIDDARSHWIAKAPGRRHIEWDAEIVASRENEMIGWRSTGGDVDNAGSVRFEDAPAGRGTVMRIQLQYNPPAGRIGNAVAKLLGESPEQQIAEDLHRFKQLMEAGEIPTTAGQPSGRATRNRERAFEERPRHESIRRADPIETASEESFPASDSPPWTAGGGV